MCAIVSWAGRCKRGQWAMVHRLLTELLVTSECRGTDATGFAAVDGRGCFVADKEPLPSKAFIHTSRSWQRLSSSSCVVAHCRAATHGSPRTGDNRNNHPHLTRDLAVVVNGVAHNYQTVAHRHGLRLGTECDSEVVLRLVDAADGPAEGLATALAELDGGMAAAVLDARTRNVLLGRNEGRPTWQFRLAGVAGTFACSTREIAEHALYRTLGRDAGSKVELLLPLAANVVTAMEPSGRLTAVRPERPRVVERGLLFA